MSAPGLVLSRRVEIAASGGGEAGWIGVRILAPRQWPTGPVSVLFCFPGGGMTGSYFDLPGEAGFSFARAMTSRGMLCVMFDHPGTGESSVPAAGFGFTADCMARQEASAVLEILSDLLAGTWHPELPALPGVWPVGVGHSMGAMVVSLQQAAWRPFAALALLGFTTKGLPEVLTAAERAACCLPDGGRSRRAALAEARFGEAFGRVAQKAADSPASFALSQVTAALPATVALQSMLPDNIAGEAARIDVPIFLAAGDRDLTGPPCEIPAAFRNCPELTLHVMRDTGHHPFVTDASAHFYARFANFVFGLRPMT